MGSSDSKRKGIWYDLKNTSFGESRSYLFEYGLLLLLTGGLIYIIMAMVQSFYNVATISLPFIFVQDSEVFLLSALTVILPLVIILIQRTSESETANPAVKNLSWRKAFLGVFLAFVSIWAVLSSIFFINSILEYLSNGLLSATDFDWKSSLTYLVAASILILTAWTFGNDYRYVSKDHFSGLRHFYRYALVALSLVVGLLFLFFPFRENQTANVDQQIIADLYAVSAMADSYKTEKSRLPASLSDLSLSSAQSQRASLYSYTYEIKTDSTYALCADFHGSGSVTTAEMSSTGTPNLNVHSAGINCYDFGNPGQAGSAVESATDMPLATDESSSSLQNTQASPEATSTEETIY